MNRRLTLTFSEEEYAQFLQLVKKNPEMGLLVITCGFGEEGKAFLRQQQQEPPLWSSPYEERTTKRAVFLEVDRILRRAAKGGGDAFAASDQ